MGLFSFIGDITSATVKVAVTPIAVVKDVVEGEPFETTSEVLDSAKDDLASAIKELLD